MSCCSHYKRKQPNCPQKSKKPAARLGGRPIAECNDTERRRAKTITSAPGTQCQRRLAAYTIAAVMMAIL